MKIAKFVLMAAVLVSLFGVAAFAGAPAPTTEKPVVEPVTPPPPPPPAPTLGAADPSVITNHFTVGLGIGGSPILGFVDKDGIDFPRDEYGLISGIGFGYTWFSGYPTVADEKAAVIAVKRNNPGVSDSDVPTLARNMLGVNHLTYVELGILNAEMGYEWLLTDNVRTRLGIGLPTLISVGINLDF